jgi:hypothetical protein
MRSQARMAFVISSADNIRRMSKHYFFMRLPCVGAETLSRSIWIVSNAACFEAPVDPAHTAKLV